MDKRMTIPQAALALGVSEKTVRRRIKAGALKAAQIPTAGGFEYRVDIDRPRVDNTTGLPDREDRGDTDLMTLAAMDVLRSQLAEKERQLAQLQEERVRMAEQLGYARAQMQQMQHQLRLLNEGTSEGRSEIVEVQPRGFGARLRRLFGGK